MSIILNIDTTLNFAYVSIAKNGITLQDIYNSEQKEHASFLVPAIQSLTRGQGIHFNELDSIAVTTGPGSYTGIRVGLATAKGLCYTLNKPLICINTLDAIANLAIHQQLKVDSPDPLTLVCPMIDARRMEVFSALYHFDFTRKSDPKALILAPDSFDDIFLTNKIIFIGNGADKWKQICTNKSAIFSNIEFNSMYMSALSYKEFSNNNFESVTYSRGFYLKEFHNTRL